MRAWWVSEFFSLWAVSLKSCRSLLLFVFFQRLFRKLACQSIYISILIILLGILWHSGNDHHVMKSDEIIFQESWRTVLEYSIHFISYHFWLHRNLVKVCYSTWGELTSWYCFISLKRNFMPMAAGSQQCFSDIFRNYCLKEKSWKKKSMFTSSTRWALTLDSPSLHRLSSLFRSIETIMSGHHLGRAQLGA